MKIFFAGTPEFAVKPLSGLLVEHEVVGVFTQPDRPAGRGKQLQASPVKQLAQKHGIPVYQPATMRGQVEVIKQSAAELMVVVAYGLLLPDEILDAPPLGCVNIHASILPRWRGAAPIQRAIEAGDTVTGVSIMKMERGLDTGPVFKILTTPISEQDTALSLHDKLANLGLAGILTTLAALDAKVLPEPTPQNDSLANYASKISKQEARVDWSASARLIQARIRAFIPWPICQTQHGQTRVRLWQASVIDGEPEGQVAGEITRVDEQGIVVACGQGLIRLEALQRDGGKVMQSKAFLNGYPMHSGDHFV
ncbi:MAG: methionyl-tRNA formyltransferase [Gammaproteobacteria bacterium]|nr:methionyl-tRNA formyltransferase [Gammaproteobacteria bacterium]